MQHINPYWTLERQAPQPVLIARRTAEPQPDLAQVESSFAELEAAMDAEGREGKALIIDFRAAPSNPDPGFHAVVSPHARRLARGFERLAALAGTEAGRAECRLYFQEHGVSAQVFATEAEAFAALV